MREQLVVGGPSLEEHYAMKAQILTLFFFLPSIANAQVAVCIYKPGYNEWVNVPIDAQGFQYRSTHQPTTSPPGVKLQTGLTPVRMRLCLGRREVSNSAIISYGNSQNVGDLVHLSNNSCIDLNYSNLSWNLNVLDEKAQAIPFIQHNVPRDNRCSDTFIPGWVFLAGWKYVQGERTAPGLDKPAPFAVSSLINERSYVVMSETPMKAKVCAARGAIVGQQKENLSNNQESTIVSDGSCLNVEGKGIWIEKGSSAGGQGYYQVLK